MDERKAFVIENVTGIDKHADPDADADVERSDE